MKNKVAIVAANYYENITNDLVDGVKNNLNESFDTSTYFVDGAWEIIYKINDLSENDSIDKFVAIGVIIKGKRETKMIGPFRDDNKLLTVKAITNPRIITNGSVIKQKVIVKRKALKNFTFSNSKKFCCQKAFFTASKLISLS